MKKQQELCGIFIEMNQKMMQQVMKMRKITISFTDSKSFNYKTNVTGELDAGENRKNSIKAVVPLKHLRNFWRTFKYFID